MFTLSNPSFLLFALSIYLGKMSTEGSSPPADFVFVDDIIPNIQQVLRYNTKENFIGHPLPGYAPQASAMLTKQAADALAKVQQTLNANDYSLLIYDAYRAQHTVDYFFEWLKNTSDQSQKSKCYPYVDKSELAATYLSPTSEHSRGSTVDLTIIKLGKDVKEIEPVERTLKDGRKILWLDDGSVDMGASFDLFDESSHHDTQLITDEQKTMRAYLKAVMDNNGFTAFMPEWWHYNLRNEPYPTTFFDFDVMEKKALHSSSHIHSSNILSVMLVLVIVVFSMI